MEDNGSTVALLLSELPSERTKKSRDFLRPFFRALARDHRADMLAILDTLDGTTKLALVNGRLRQVEDVEISPSVWNCDDFEKQLAVQYPLSLCVVYQSISCFVSLLDLGADLFLMDTRGNNLIHLLVYMYVDQPSDKVLRMYDEILSRVKTAEARRKLLLHRSDDGLDPLGLAARLCCTKMFRAILYTEGVFRTVVSQQGKVATNSFTLNYRKNEREHPSSSFLWQLAWLEELPLTSEAISDIMKIPVVKVLLHRRFLAALPYIIVWFLLRTLHFVIFIAIDIKHNNMFVTFSCHANGTMRDRTYSLAFSDYLAGYYQRKDPRPVDLAFQIVYGVAYGFGAIAINLGELMFLRKKSTLITRQLPYKLLRPFLINADFYRVVMIILAFHFFLQLLFVSKMVLDAIPQEIEGAILATISLDTFVLLTFGILYFIQLMPAIGFFVIGFQRMLAALAQFAVLQICVSLVFFMMFRHVNMYFCKGDSERFSCRVLDGLYTTFLIMMNMGELVPENKCGDVGETLLRLLHVLYAFIVGVMTINYLIAIMSSVYNLLAFSQSSSVKLHRMYMFLVIERRLNMLALLLPARWRSPVEDIIEVREIDNDFEHMHHIRLEHNMIKLNDETKPTQSNA